MPDVDHHGDEVAGKNYRHFANKHHTDEAIEPNRNTTTHARKTSRTVLVTNCELKNVQDVQRSGLPLTFEARRRGTSFSVPPAPTLAPPR
ncbi:hypothetical protein EVAR_92184_1 [Eumeta japonica]|uniref:Uncharacterized protein n=1 Tax=Eumeta variegata TaxID=151549 RepID=A0A4C2A8V0_EUMVA|nr:hypothetical protein EVAR_92184_1 [Eumeta japonica]